MMNVNETRTYLVLMTRSATSARKFYAVPSREGGDPVSWATTLAWSKRLKTGTTIHYWTRTAHSMAEAVSDVAQVGIPADGSFVLPDPMAVASAARAKIGGGL